jgi:hypothetical protein
MRPVSEPTRHRLRPEASRATAQRMNRRFALTFLLVVVLVVAAHLAGLRDDRGAGGLAVPFAILLVLAGLSYRRRMIRFRARWDSFEIAIGDDAIAREVAGIPPIRIDRKDVASIQEIGAGLAVRSTAGQGLVVPRELAGYENVRDRLAAWRPIGS